jgi:FtsP/CotA-like multicopper oxidase with cupredoxin domain
VSRIFNFYKRRRSEKDVTRKSITPNPESKSLSSTALIKVGAEFDGKELNRREFLKLSAIATGGLLTAVVLESHLKPLTSMPKAVDQLLERSEKKRTEMGPVEVLAASTITALDPSSIPQFENQLTSPPPVYQPEVVTSEGKVIQHDYTVTMASFEQQILPPSMNLLTPVWGYGGNASDAVTGASLGFVQSTPGPTFEAVRGIPVQVKWQNSIISTYMLPVDPTIHWANPNGNSGFVSPFPTYPPGFPNVQSPVPLVTHLHGGENQSFSDWGPDSWFTSTGIHGPAYSTVEKTDSNAAVYHYPNTQQPTTLWYHDHALGLTRLSIMSGLAGFYIIRDPNDSVAPLLPTGKYDVPLCIQDRSFNTDGSLYYPTAGDNPQIHPYWQCSFLGNVIVVNGKAWPNMNVDQGLYRFRILNASNSRFYQLSFSNGMSFVQIGSDGGYLKTSATLTSLLIAPAERADILVDFSNLPAGITIVLANAILTTGTEAEKETVGQVMQFTVTSVAGFAPKTLPSQLNATLISSFPTLQKINKRRMLTLIEASGAGGTLAMYLDGQYWSAPISETPELGSTEEWVVVNPTDSAHPIHLHLIQFQIVSRQTFDNTTYMADWTALNGQIPLSHLTKNLPSLSPYLTGQPVSPAANEQGWKDTALMYAGQVTTIRVRFAQQDGSSFPFDATAGPGYVWHCHLLEHEDNEMMRPYKVIAPASITLPLTISVVAVAVAAFLLLYSYQRKRRQGKEELISQLDFLGANSEMLQSGKIRDENDYYQDPHDPFG